MTQTNTYKQNNSLKNYFAKTFSTVAIGVTISTIFAFLTNILLPVFIRSAGFSLAIVFGPIIIELIIAFYFSANLMRMSRTKAWACYFIYSVATGISFSTLILSYNIGSVALAFLSTAIMFVCMAIIGHTSNIDYTRIYSLFLPAVIAGFIITLLNAFIFKSPWVNMSIVYIGLILFLIITAADVQKLKNFYYASQTDDEISEKLMILGAFQLYLDFVNLFIRILQIFGRRRNDR